MPRLPLTDQQKDAVCAPAGRLFIEAAPGSGKTTVAAERFGVLRFARGRSAQGPVTAVSFTRSATGELSRRVRNRWGSASVSWPHVVLTIDAFIHNIVHHLLRQSIIQWPGGHVELQVLDDWRGHRGYRWLLAGSFRRIATLSAESMVTSFGRRLREPEMAFGSLGDFHAQLEAGRCTHDEIRQVTMTALARRRTREAIAEFMQATVGHLVVDEVFDANKLDLDLVLLACEAGIPVTLIGDPWQALYGFRGATPELVPQLIDDWGFASWSLSQSFRFKSLQMQEISDRLRSGVAVCLPDGTTYDVMLASQWGRLWAGPANVLPLSFGRSSNKVDAAMILLLDHIVRSHFGRRAIFMPEALALLDLDQDAYRTTGPELFTGVAATLAEPRPDAPRRALDALRPGMQLLGAPRRPRAATGDSATRQLELMAALSTRLRSGERLVPGMTIHQAKGCEWDRVGVRLAPSEFTRLGSGLHRDSEGDRCLYVALTRARHGVCSVA